MHLVNAMCIFITVFEVVLHHKIMHWPHIEADRHHFRLPQSLSSEKGEPAKAKSPGTLLAPPRHPSFSAPSSLLPLIQMNVHWFHMFSARLCEISKQPKIWTQVQVWIDSLIFINYMTVGKLFNIFEPQWSHILNDGNNTVWK